LPECFVRRHNHEFILTRLGRISGQRSRNAETYDSSERRAKIKMELNIKINIEELLGKSKELDFTKVIKLWQKLQKGEEITFLNDMLKIQKLEEKKE
jgi:hypothetical protein